MVKILEIKDGITGRKLQTDYQDEIFGWLQNPTQTVPTLHLGHQAVLRAAFEKPSLRELAKSVNCLERREGQTATQLLIAGVNYADIEAATIDHDLTGSLESVGAAAFANEYTRRMGIVASSYADVFSQQNFAANEMYMWLQHRTAKEPKTIHALSQHRINTLIKTGDPVEARKTLDKVPINDLEVASQLLAGFSAKVILSSYSQEDVENVAEVIRKTIWKRYAIPALSSKEMVTNTLMNKRGLRGLQPDSDWGSKRICSKEDDGILETRLSKSSVDPRARILCSACPVRLHCLHDSLDSTAMVVRGGLGASERAKLFKILHPRQTKDESDEQKTA